jgi:LysR family glycine cleavage system transcriptional activator
MFETNELVLSAVRAGLGLTLEPTALVEQDIASGTLVKICKLKDRGLGYYMLTRKDRETPALVKFQKWLRRVAMDA